MHRRSVWQSLGIYVTGSWLALQVVDILADNVGLPAWVFPFAIVLLVIGLPIVLATASRSTAWSRSTAPTWAWRVCMRSWEIASRPRR